MRQVELVNQPQGFDRYRAAGSVIGGPGGRVPGIEVTAVHHHFVGLVGAGQLTHHVVDRAPGGIELVVDVDPQNYRDVVNGRRAVDASVVLVAHHQRGQVGVVGGLVVTRGGLLNDDAIGTAGIRHLDQGAVLDQKLVHLLSNLDRA